MAQNSNLEAIRLHLIDELTPDKREKGKYICPICGSGSSGKRDSDAAFAIYRDGVHGKCFSCGFYGDIFDLEAAKEGISLSEATQKVLARFTGSFSASAPVQQRTQQPVEEREPERSDFSDYISRCHAELKGSDGEKYLRSRGLTDQTMDRFMLGFDASQRRIILPYDRRGSYYSTRAIDDNAFPKHGKPGGVRSILFNGAALQREDPCFVVESPLCAISVMQEGGSAIALSGTGENLLLGLLDKKRPSAPLILCLDNDQPKEDGSRPGQDAQAKLAKALDERGIPYVEIPVMEECKDPNELLQMDASRLRKNVTAAIQVAKHMAETIRQNELEDYEARTTSASFADFESFLTENAQRPPIPTGFSTLDGILNGGLTAGLYIMGAISSLGKTSWMLNIADNISSAGRDVLYFSLEMSRNELIAKSISRLSFQIFGEKEGETGEAYSTFGVLNSKGEKTALLREAMQRYQQTAGKHMWIFEGVGSYGVADIVKQVEDHIRITGRTPVVFIDYLQILSPEDIHYTDKQNTDKAVTELKRLSAQYNVPVFAISSLNRLNYNEPVSMSAFKESGAIEYGSDVLLGLQLHGIGYLPGEKKTPHVARVRALIKAAEKDPQIKLDVVVLKNRNGGRGGSGTLRFDKKFNSFQEVMGMFQEVNIDTPFDDGLGLDDDDTSAL